VQRRLCRSAPFFFFQRDFTCTRDSDSEQKVAKSFSITGSLSMAGFPFLPARGTLYQRGDFNLIWHPTQRKKQKFLSIFHNINTFPIIFFRSVGGKKKIMNPIEIYNLFRSRIEHEDNLLNQRTNFFLVIQGFLISAYVTSFQISSTNFQPKTIQNLISISALISCLFTFLAVIAAVVSINNAGKEYKSKIKEIENADYLPSSLFSKSFIHFLGLLLPFGSIFLFFVIWLIL
jgi:hypothetical protein